MNTDTPLDRVSSGIQGLDTLLNGGFVTGRMYLATGAPGTGKTTLGMEFLEAGLDAAETVLFIHGEESRVDLIANAATLDIDLDAAEFLDVGPESDFFTETQSYDVVEPHDIEEDHLIADIRTAIEDLNPDRVLIDPITQLQFIEPTEYQFRKRIIAFTRFLKNSGTTVVATKTPGARMQEQLKSLSDGVIGLEYGDAGRRITVPKHRGVGQQDGSHGLEIRASGLDVYPALVPDEPARTMEPRQLSSGLPNLDSLLGGGLERGTVTIISGPSGVGKSTTAMEFLETAAGAGDAAHAYLFEESLATFTYRAETFGIPVTRLREDGPLIIEAIEPLAQSPEEFARLVKAQVDVQEPALVVIDGTEGYRTAIKGDEGEVDLRRKLHALTRFLTNQDVSVLLIDERSAVTGLPQPTSANLSYIADNIVFQNYLELEGQLQRVVGVLKKRVGGFEDTLRRFTITADGLEVQEPVTDIHGVLGGTPEWTGDERSRWSK